jgi:histone-lysine N-methyltransferase SETMAR
MGAPEQQNLWHMKKTGLTVMTLTTLGSKVMNHNPYSPDLAPSGFSLFGRLMEHLGGQKFNTRNELEHGDLNWLLSQATYFYVAGISALPWRWKKCPTVERQYLGKE